ncbi:hypothetical protein [Salinivibrio costicola]|uniref:hypothetical protein n=1 Tax=Salinivibrio costicola TaxID=51367 RepID=UPI003F6EED9D
MRTRKYGELSRGIRACLIRGGLVFVYLMANNWAHANDEDVASVDQDAFEFDESLLLGYPQEGAMDGILQNVLR